MSIIWGETEIEDFLTGKGVDGLLAENIEAYVQYITTTAFPLVGRDASLVEALSYIIRPTVAVARACWGVLGTAGTTAVVAATAKTWILANRPDLANDATTISFIMCNFLGDAAVSDDVSGPLLPSKAYDDDPNSLTFGTIAVLSQNKYATQVERILTLVAKYMRHFAIGWELYGADDPNFGGKINKAPLPEVIL